MDSTILRIHHLSKPPMQPVLFEQVHYPEEIRVWLQKQENYNLQVFMHLNYTLKYIKIIVVELPLQG